MTSRHQFYKHLDLRSARTRATYQEDVPCFLVLHWWVRTLSVRSVAIVIITLPQCDDELLLNNSEFVHYF